MIWTGTNIEPPSNAIVLMWQNNPKYLLKALSQWVTWKSSSILHSSFQLQQHFRISKWCKSMFGYFNKALILWKNAGPGVFPSPMGPMGPMGLRPKNSKLHGLHQDLATNWNPQLNAPTEPLPKHWRLTISLVIKHGWTMDHRNR